MLRSSPLLSSTVDAGGGAPVEEGGDGGDGEDEDEDEDARGSGDSGFGDVGAAVAAYDLACDPAYVSAYEPGVDALDAAAQVRNQRTISTREGSESVWRLLRGAVCLSPVG